MPFGIVAYAFMLLLDLSRNSCILMTRGLIAIVQSRYVHIVLTIQRSDVSQVLRNKIVPKMSLACCIDPAPHTRATAYNLELHQSDRPIQTLNVRIYRCSSPQISQSTLMIRRFTLNYIKMASSEVQRENSNTFVFNCQLYTAF